MLGFPLDYLHVNYVAHAVSIFGKFFHWHDNDRVKGRVLVKALIQYLDAIPHKLVIKKGNTQGGQGQSWTGHVFILNTDFPDFFLERRNPFSMPIQIRLMNHSNRQLHWFLTSNHRTLTHYGIIGQKK